MKCVKSKRNMRWESRINKGKSRYCSEPVKHERGWQSSAIKREDLLEDGASIEGPRCYTLRIYTVFTWRPLFPDCSQLMLGMVQVLKPIPSGPEPSSSNRQLCLGDWGSWSCPEGWTFYTRPLSLLSHLRIRPALQVEDSSTYIWSPLWKILHRTFPPPLPPKNPLYF